MTNSTFTFTHLAIAVIAGMLLGAGLGWGLRGERTPPPVAADNNAVSSQPRSGGSAVATSGSGPNIGGGPAGSSQLGSDNAVGGNDAARPLGLSSQQIMANLLQGLENGTITDRSKAEARLHLLLETGEEGRRALLDFLQQNIDYPTGGGSNLNRYNSLRFKILEMLGESSTPEGEQALRYVAGSSPNLHEVLKAVDLMEDREYTVDEKMRESMRQLAHSTLSNLPEDTSERDTAIRAAGVLARDLKDEQLLAVLENHLAVLAEAEASQHKNTWSYIFASLPGPQQQASLQRIGLDSPLAQQLAQNPAMLPTTDFGQPAVRQLVTDLITNGKVEADKIGDILKSQYLLQVTEVNVDGYDTGASWGGSTQFKDAAEKAAFTQRLEGVRRMLEDIAASSTAPQDIRELSRMRLKDVAKTRQDIDTWRVRD